MTIVYLQPDGVAIAAQAERQGSAAFHGGGAGRPLGGRSGFRVDTASTILTATSTTWTLVPCSAMLDPGASTHQGMYGWSTDANVTGSVTAADATYARKDIVYIQVNDSSAGDGSGATTAPVLYLAGTPSASPVAPTLPARSFLVGTITVPQSGGGSPTVVLNPARYVAAGGIQPVYSLAERDALTKYDMLAVRRGDIAERPIEVWDGATWRREVKTEAGQSTSPPILKMGIGTALSTNASGDGTFIVPGGGFPTAMTSCTLADATPISALGAIIVKWTSNSSSKTDATYRIYDAAGVPVANIPASLALSYVMTGY